MKRACFTLLCWLLPTAAFAAPCLPGSLGSYIALGSTGCTVGSALFSHFSNLPLQGGASEIPDSSTFVNPLLGPTSVGFRFNVNSQTTAGSFLERVIGFRIGGASITGASVGLTDSSAIPPGAVTVIDHLCLGGTYASGASGCSGVDTSLTGFNLGFDQDLSESMAFAGRSLLGVVVDIAVDGGGDGSASLRSATAEFTAVPEPATLTLVGLGLGAGYRRWRTRRGGQSV